MSLAPTCRTFGFNCRGRECRLYSDCPLLSQSLARLVPGYVKYQGTRASYLLVQLVQLRSYRVERFLLLFDHVLRVVEYWRDACGSTQSMVVVKPCLLFIVTLEKRTCLSCR